MTRNWDYRYELRDLQEHDNGTYSYSTKEQGDAKLRKTVPTGLLKLLAWEGTLAIAKKSGKNVITYVTGNKIISRTF